MRNKKVKQLKRAAVVTLTTGMMLQILAPVVQPLITQASEMKVTTTQVSNQKRNVMYYGDWSIWGGQGNFYPKDIPAEQLTHLNFAFLDFDAQGNLIFTDKDAAVGAPVGQEGAQWGAPNAGILNALQELRERNPNLKLGISVGGWSKSGDFAPMAANPEARANFIDNIIKFIEYTNMDFIDLDWEFPGEVREGDLVDNKNDEGTPHATPEDGENYVVLLEELKAALNLKEITNGKEYELSVAIPAPKKKQQKLEIDRLFNAVDFANVMTYDLRGAWDDTSGHQTGLYPNPNDSVNTDNLSIDESVDFLIANGAEPEKIVIGAAFYTRGWDKVAKGTNSELPGLFQTAEKTGKDADQTPSYGAPNEAPMASGDGGRAAGAWTYRGLEKLKAQYPGLKEYWDDVAKAPYLYDETSGKFFTYDNAQSILEKANYVNENNLGGMIGWMASQDKETTSGSAKRDELTQTMKTGLFGSASLPEHEIIYHELDVEAHVVAYEQEWGASRKGYEITLRNNEKAEESDAVLKEVERGAETVKAPKLYLKTNQALASGDHMAGTVSYQYGYTVVDLQSVWEGKNIEAGQTYTFKLSGDATIESIELVQRMSTNGPELGKQLIYGEKDESENTAPVLFGVQDQTIEIGTKFDEMHGITAWDKEDGDITSAITINGRVDLQTIGTYPLTYRVVDSQGLETQASRVITVVNQAVDPEIDFGVGEGIVWPEQVYAPFADMTLWNNGDFSNNGALNLQKIVAETGVKHFNLGFIQATGGVNDGKVNWGWGGHEVLSERHPENAQYQGIKKAIRDVRELGGDVTISLGGLNGTAIWEASQDEQTLYQTYKEIVEGYGLTRLDLDIEGAATDKVKNTVNAQAIKRVQDETGIDIVLTLAVMPTGLTQVQLDVLEAYLSAGVDIEVVNIMTMCYGTSAGDYALASVQAIDNTMKQVQQYFAEYANIHLSEAQAYRKIGATPSVGFEGAAHPIFAVADTKVVVEHAIAKKIGMVSMWSINRDAQAQVNEGIYGAYEHTTIMKQFGEQSVGKPIFVGLDDVTITVGEEFDARANVSATDAEDGDLTAAIIISGSVDPMTTGVYELTYRVTDSDGNTTIATRNVTVEESVITPDKAPVLKGITDVTITVGEEFDARTGVSATDAEDGDLTAAIIISGSVDPMTAGVYELTYRVTDSASNTTTQARTITVKANTGDTYDPKAIYYGGEIVTYNGEEYQAKWWTQGETPGQAAVWEKIVKPNADGSVDWYEGMVATGGTVVKYQGKTYEAKWWTTSTPGSDDSWQLIS